MAPHLSPEATREAIQDRLAGLLLELFQSSGSQAIDITPESIKRWHGRIFGDLFQFSGGRFRQTWEKVVFPVRTAMGASTDVTVMFGAPSEAIEERLREACADFQTLAGRVDRNQTVSNEKAAEVIAKLLGQMLRIHPFIDGNHRTAAVVLAAGLNRLGKPILKFGPVLDEFEGALELATLGDDHAVKLAELLERELSQVSG